LADVQPKNKLEVLEMDYTQNAKIAQVTEKSLIIGVDIGSESHYARAFNWRGQEYNQLMNIKPLSIN
jgi:hypothetical protein